MAHRIPRLRGCGDDWRAAETGLVREKPAGNSIPHGFCDPRADKSSHGGLTRKGAGDDELDCRAEFIPIEGEQDEATDHISGRHEGNQHGAKFRNRRDAAEDHGCCDHGQKNPNADFDLPVLNREGDQALLGHHQIGDGVGLNHISDAKRRDGGEDGEKNPRPARFEGILQNIHRAAAHLAIGIHHPVFHGQQRLAVFRRDSKNSGEPHPKHRPGPANKHRASHAVDISCPDRRGECGRQRTKLADVARRALIFRHRKPDRMTEMALNESRAPREIKVGSKK